MKNLRQAFQGILIALVSIGLILGGFSLSQAEGKLTSGALPTRTSSPALTASPTLQPTLSPTPSHTPAPSLTAAVVFTSTPTPTLSLSPTPTHCPPPVGWIPYLVKSGDTFASLAIRFNSNSLTLQQANCLPANGLNAGQTIYVPPLPTSTPVRIQCGPPAGWIFYIVQPGDTLYHLSLSYQISVSQLQQANCLGSSDLIHTGQKLYVPPWAPILPPPTLLPQATDTPGQVLPSDTPTETPVILATDTPVPAPTDTPVELPTDTTAP